MEEKDSRLLLRDYQIIHELGSGSFGSAHLALHTPSNTKHVIKRIKIFHMTSKEVQNARQEVQVLSSLSHPYITQFQGSCEEDGFLLIAMDYCAGGDLHSLITKRNGILFPEDRVLDWFVQLCLAIKYIHDRKILHRDIKSQNIFLTEDGKVRLGDFGIAKILNSSSELARTCIGTPYYLSPEMCENKPYNNKSDIWALGCVLYEMLTLKHAFEANNMKALILKIIKGNYPPVAPRYSRDIRLLLSQIFQREPQARPSICAVLRKIFILKRVSKFISGCEEEELRKSLIRRKYHVPASSRKVVLTRRPPDITEPAAKYGVSLNRKMIHKPSVKPVGRLPKQMIPSGKQAKMTQKNTERLRQDTRKRCPSEDILSSKDVQKSETNVSGKRYQKRSKSVPNAFRQNDNPKVQDQCNKMMNPSPIKLKLMLDSAGLKRREKDEATDDDLGHNSKFENKTSCESPRSPGWLVDEFLTKKLKVAYGKRKLVEALMVDQGCTAASCDAAVARCMPTDEGSSASYVSKPGAVASEKNVFERTERPEMCKPEIKSNGDVKMPNPKDVKDFANQSLKWQESHWSEDDEGNDREEAVPDMSPEQLREVMHKKLQNVFEERTKKMSQMVSERRQWGYEMEKLRTSVSQNNNENILKLVNFTSHDTDKEGKIHHKSKKTKKLHEIPSQWDSTTSNCLQPEQTDEKPDKPSTAIGSKSTLIVKEQPSVHQTESADVVLKSLEEHTPDPQKNEQQVENNMNDAQNGKDAIKDTETDGYKSVDKISYEEVKCNNDLSGDSTPELLMPQDSQSTANKMASQEPTSEDFVKSQHTTPNMRARWGAVHTADLEKSPLETTASEMDTTTSSDCVVVYREAGERKQWKKGCNDIVSLLAEAQIIEDKKVPCDTEKVKSLMDEEKLVGKASSEHQHRPVQMNSTFTLKEGLKNCEGLSCVCKSHISTTNSSPKPPRALCDTFKIDKSSFEKEMKSIGPPLLNSTFDMSKLPSDKVINASVPITLNSTYVIDKKELIDIDTVHQAGCEENSTNSQVSACGTKISKEDEEHRENFQATDKISCDTRESGNAIPKPEERLTYGEVVSKEVHLKTKGGLLEKLRQHITPQLKNKYQKLDNNVIVSKSPLATEVSLQIVSLDSEPVPKGTYTPVRKKKGSMRLGISGILRRLSSKHITKMPMRSRSMETVQKDLDSFEDCNTAHSDADSPQQESMVECGTVKFLNDVACRKADRRVTEHTTDSEDRNCKFSLKTEDSISVDNHSSLDICRDNDSNATTIKMYSGHKTESCVTRKETKQLEAEGTESNKCLSNSAMPSGMNFDEMSADSGIDSQKTSICQTSSTDCSNSRILFCGSSGGSRNETGTGELQKTNNDHHDWLAFSNFSEATTSTVLLQSSQMKQGKGLGSTPHKSLSSNIQDLDKMKTNLLDATCSKKFQDVSPVSTCGIHISLNISNEQEDGAVQSQCEDVELDCRQTEQTEHESVTQMEPNDTQLLRVEQDFQTTQNKVNSCNEVSNNQYKQKNSQSSSVHPIFLYSPARARPTMLNIGKKTTDIMQESQDSASGDCSLSGRRAGSQELIKKTTKDKLCVNLHSEPTTSHNMKPCEKELISSSDEESEDLANLRQSMEFLISSGEHRKEDNKSQQPELWHLDRDGGVVPGGGGVYGWIEEQRAKLEDELSLDLFKQAYHLLEAAQEREGCVVGESVSQVERLLGPCQHHLAYDILQLVVAESVYHN